MNSSLVRKLILCASACVFGLPCVAKDREVFIASGNLFSSGPMKPLEDLSAALKKDTQSRLFRVGWDSSASLLRDGVVMLYNRRDHTLKYFSQSDRLVSDDAPAVREAVLESVLYKGVTDAMIHRLLAKYGKSNTATDELLPRLQKMGARKRVLIYKPHRYVVR